jgi:hypothetical protein
MIGFTRFRSSRAIAILAVGALIATGGGVAWAEAASTGYKACANSGGKLALENAKGNCPTDYSKVTVGAQGPKGAPGKQGPSGVVSMTQYDPDGATPITGGSYGFLGTPPEEDFTDADTAAEVTATVDTASHDGNTIDEIIGVCYEPVGGSTITDVTYVIPQFTAAAESFFAQSVSGDVGDLTPGDYYVGLCAEDQTDVDNGAASVTITMAETSDGVSYDGVKAADTKHPTN